MGINTCIGYIRRKQVYILMQNWFFVALLHGVITGVFTAPTSRASLHSDNAASYLLQFGYVTPRHLQETTAVCSDCQTKTKEANLADGISRFQRKWSLGVTGTLTTETLDLMTSPRCGEPDYLDNVFETPKTVKYTTLSRSKRYLNTKQRWRNKIVTYMYAKNSTSMSFETMNSSFTHALNQWTHYSGMKSRRVNRQSDANIVVKFAAGNHNDGSPFDGPGNVLAHAFFPGNNLGGDVHFDDEESWLEATENVHDINFLSTALHELGHSFGLGHSTVDGAIMHPFYNTYAGEKYLSKDEIHGLRALYSNYVLEAGIPPPLGDEDEEEVGTLTPIVEQHELCSQQFDSIGVLRDQVYAFRGRLFFAFNEGGSVKNQYPVALDTTWRFFPEEIERIDAFFEIEQENRIWFFSGRRVFEFEGTELKNEFVLQALGFGLEIQKVDASFVWSANKQVYIVAGDSYWKIDTKRKQILPHYPRAASRSWQGLPPGGLAAAFDYGEVLYFVDKSGSLAAFNNELSRVATGVEEMPLATSLLLIYCHPQTPQETRKNSNEPIPPLTWFGFILWKMVH